MNRFKLSALSSVLLSIGAVSPASYATECNFPAEVTGNHTFEQCIATITEATRESDAISVRDGVLDIKNSTLIANSQTNERGSLNIVVGARDSMVNIDKSTLEQAHQDGLDVLRLIHSQANIKDSTLISNSDWGVIDLENGSSATLNNSTVLGKEENPSAFVYYGENNSLNITNGSKVRAYTFVSGSWTDDVKKAAIQANIENSDISSTILAATYIDEESTSEDVINIVANASNLSGQINSEDPNSTINLTLNNSNWTATQYQDDEETYLNNSLTNLSLQNSQVNLEKSLGFQTLTIINDLSGTGTFSLNTDLANQQSDKIVVKGKDSGDFGLKINDSGNEPNAANGKVTLVETQTGQANFRLLNRDYVDAGAYRYRLVKDGTNWLLSNHNGEQTSDTSSSKIENTHDDGLKPDNNQYETTTTQQIQAPVSLSEKSNALVSLRQAQLLLVNDSLTGIHQRLSEVKSGQQGQVWVRNTNDRYKLDSLATSRNSQSSGFKQDIHVLQLGADAAITDSWRLGGFVGSMRSSVDFNGEYGTGKLNGQSLGLYAAYLANNGFYWDNIAKYDHLKTKSDTLGKRKYNGYTLSSEIGRIHTLGSWTITPQLQFAWTRLSAQTDEDVLNAYLTRAGVRIAKHFEFDQWQLQPYAEFNGIKIHTNSNQVRVNQYQFDVAETGSHIKSALGLNANIGQHRFGIEGAMTHGKKLDQPYKIQLTYRYSW